MDEIKVAILDTGIGYSKYIPQKCIESVLLKYIDNIRM